MNRRAFLRRSAGFVVGLYVSDALLSRVAPATATAAPDTLPVGTVRTLHGQGVPRGWLICNGRLLKVSSYPKLYAVLGNSFGPLPNKRVFRLPDMRIRTVQSILVNPTHRAVYETSPIYIIKAA